MFGFPIDVYSNLFCENKTVYRNTITPKSVLNNNHHSISYHSYREAVAAKTIRVAKQGSDNNLYNMFINIITSERIRFLLEKLAY